MLEALRDLARAARARSHAKVIAVTGSVGKTGTKEALRLALTADGETHASAASYNNHWGVPLSLARCPGSAKYAVFEIGMNHAGEITPLTKLVRPHVAIVTAIEPVHLEYFGSLEKIADAKAEIFAGIEPGGAAVLNRDNGQYARLAAAAKAAGVARIVSFGEHAKADARLLRHSLQADCSTVEASILGQEVTYKLGAPGKHLVLNSLGVLAAVSLVGADLALAALALNRLKAATGRGARTTLRTPSGSALLIDESYNANPASMAAAIALLGQAPVGPHGRRIAVLGDMLELGAQGAALHRAWPRRLRRANVDLVYCSRAADACAVGGSSLRPPGRLCRDRGGLEPAVLDAIRDGDAVMVKGSLGSKMGPIVKALERQFPRQAALEQAHESISQRFNPMFYWLTELSDKVSFLNVFRYITFRTGGAIVTALVFVFLFGGPMIDLLRIKQGKGQPIRTDGPQSHLVSKKGTPTMGGLMILSGLLVSTLLWANPTSPYVWIVLGVTLSFGLIGFYDDYLKVTKQSHAGFAGRTRLLAEALIAVIAVTALSHLGKGPIATSLVFPFFKELVINLGWAFVLLGTFVIVGAGNAVNLTDGLDGLAIVPVMIAAASFGLISYLVGNAVFAEYLQIHYVAGTGELAVLCGAVIGASLGFLWFNAPPASIFMGDTGSLSLGGLLGAVAVAIKHEIVLAIVGGLFVLEAVSVIVQVVSFKLTGKRVFKMAPIHHHYEQLGWTEPQIVIRFWIVAVVLALAGLATLKLR